MLPHVVDVPDELSIDLPPILLILPLINCRCVFKSLIMSEYKVAYESELVRLLLLIYKTRDSGLSIARELY